MFNIEKYLEKFSRNVKNSDLHKTKIIEIIEKHTGVNLSLSQIEIKDYILQIDASPAIKNKLFIYKAKILAEISSTIPTKVVDIR